MMVYTYLKLENYAGIYNGLHLNTIEIDFTKCRSRIVRILGDNGSGKSTILKAISPLPDDNINFIPNMPASKVVGLFDEVNGCAYRIEYKHPLDANGNRTTTMGYITKHFPDGRVENLNPTGKVSSCKDLVFSEFELDPNFLSLTRMNTNDRGLADKTPSDRKKYVNAIIEETKAYTDIFKKINKKSIFYRDTIKRITSKIDSLGNMDTLNVALAQSETATAKAEAALEQINEAIGVNKALKYKQDPDGSLELKYNDIKGHLDFIDNELSKLHRAPEKLQDPKVYEDKIKEFADSTVTANLQIEKNQDTIDKLIKANEDKAERIQEKQAKITAYDMKSYEDIKAKYDECKELVERYKKDVIALGVDINNMVSKDEYIIAYKNLCSLRDEIANYYSSSEDISKDRLEYTLAILDTGDSSPIKAIVDMNKEYIENSSKKLLELSTKETELDVKKSMMWRASQRPKACKIDSCPFIKDSLDTGYNSEKEIDKELAKVRKDIEHEKDTIESATETIKTYTHIEDVVKFINTCFLFISPIMPILERLGLGELVISRSKLLTDICNHKSWKYTDFLHDKAVDANCIDLYNKYKSDLAIYEKDMEVYDEKQSILEELQLDLSVLMESIDDATSSISELTQKNIEIKDSIDASNRVIIELEKERDLSIGYKKYSSEYLECCKAFEEIERCNAKIAELEAKKQQLTAAIQASKTRENEIKFNLKLISQYAAEINEVQDKFLLVEKIKYYTNPAQGGIQNIFLGLYMNDIIVDSNRILRSLFGGSLMLKPFIINENEFRIPVAVENGIAHDDIKSLSAGQTALVSTIISFALANKSSSKLNVLTADEVDATLDPMNRRNFPATIAAVMDLSGSKQAIMISHNIELSNSECDIILLKNDNADGQCIDGNIIWSYYD
ncbi:MAG: hypothetical protein IJ889_00690 [Eubacterium sp.]|nr:hypothetical protein [Eubacterium sp.]MBR2247421.1 hypothetical protein [Bacilli bacterium]